MRLEPPDPKRLPPWLRYLLALTVVSLALLARWPLEAWLGDRRPYLTIFGGVAIAVWLLRWKPAVVAALAAFLAAEYLIATPRFGIVFDAALVAKLAGYALSTGFIIFFGEAMHRARERAEVARRVTAEQQQLLSVTLASIGDGVIATDAGGCVTFLNAEAERLTGWASADASGQPLTTIFRIVNEETRQSVESPVEKVLRLGSVVGLANHTILVARDGRETPIDDSGAPVRRRADGAIAGVVLVFRDFTAHKQAEHALRQAHDRAERASRARTTSSLRSATSCARRSPPRSSPRPRSSAMPRSRPRRASSSRSSGTTSSSKPASSTTCSTSPASATASCSSIPSSRICTRSRLCRRRLTKSRSS